VSLAFIKDIVGLTNKKHDKTSELSRLTDEDLVRKFVNEKNQVALGEIFNWYFDNVYGIALRITRNPSFAEEVFLRLIEKGNTFRGEAAFSSWVYRGAVNASFMHKRLEKKYESNGSLDNYVPYDEKGTLMGEDSCKGLE